MQNDKRFTKLGILMVLVLPIVTVVLSNYKISHPGQSNDFNQIREFPPIPQLFQNYRDKPQNYRDEPQISSDEPQISSDEPQISSDEPQISSDKYQISPNLFQENLTLDKKKLVRGDYTQNKNKSAPSGK